MAKFFRNLSNRFRPSSSAQKTSNNKSSMFLTSTNTINKLNGVDNKMDQSAKKDIVQRNQKQQKFDARKECQCKIIFLDHTHISLIVSKKAIGQVIYNKVFEYLDLEERDYFGLQYTDHYHVHHWLDPLKKIYKQVPIGPPYTFRFCVKFYSSEPNNLKEELTRYQFFLQLKSDVQTGTLPCSISMAIELAALGLQSEFGDYNPKEHNEVFVSEFRFHPLQDEAMECAILECFRSPTCRGLNPAQAELNYLNRVKWLELYGVDMHLVEGRDGNEYRLGLTPTGMLVFDGEQKIGLFFWEKIQRLDFRNKKLTLIVEEDVEQPNADQIQLHTFVFELTSHKACKHLWKSAIEHHTFFRLKYHRPPKRAMGQLFRLGSTFKYRGRTEYENVHCNLPKDSTHSRKKSINFERRSSQRYVPRQSHIQKQKFRQEVRQQIAVANNPPTPEAYSAVLSEAKPITLSGNSLADEVLSSSASKSDSSPSTTTSGCNSTIIASSSPNNLQNRQNVFHNGTSKIFVNNVNSDSQLTSYNQPTNKTPHVTTIKINNNNGEQNKIDTKSMKSTSIPSTSSTSDIESIKEENVCETPNNKSLNANAHVEDNNDLGGDERKHVGGIVKSSCYMEDSQLSNNSDFENENIISNENNNHSTLDEQNQGNLALNSEKKSVPKSIIYEESLMLFKEGVPTVVCVAQSGIPRLTCKGADGTIDRNLMDSDDDGQLKNKSQTSEMSLIEMNSSNYNINGNEAVRSRTVLKQSKIPTIRSVSVASTKTVDSATSRTSIKKPRIRRECCLTNINRTKASSSRDSSLPPSYIQGKFPERMVQNKF